MLPEQRTIRGVLDRGDSKFENDLPGDMFPDEKTHTSNPLMSIIPPSERTSLWYFPALLCRVVLLYWKVGIRSVLSFSWDITALDRFIFFFFSFLRRTWRRSFAKSRCSSNTSFLFLFSTYISSALDILITSAKCFPIRLPQLSRFSFWNYIGCFYGSRIFTTLFRSKNYLCRSRDRFLTCSGQKF